jgi:hypothetical protein
MGILQKSMSNELSILFGDDLEGVPPEEMGAVVLYKTMTNHMVLCNQENIDALQEYLRKFDIRNINGENVSVACGQIRAVIRSLEKFGLPANLVRSLLAGFGNATNDAFKKLCKTLAAMNRSTLMADTSNISAKQKCFVILKDLENAYVELLTSNKWEGADHSGATFCAALSDDSLAAMAARVPLEEYLKNITCFNCGKKGHKASDCPEEKKPHNKPRDDHRDKKARDKPRDCRDKKARDQRRFKKAYKAAIETFALDSSSGSDEDETASPRAHKADIDDNSEDDSSSVGSLAAHAARMFSSLKE